ncbi:hypothetical protein [Aeromonas veronii]|uniref:hypothetical protein n=1 Tax=Aeromonas veronii TaxID=654 RepID=UPI0013151A46|nr:hypothetical protein [Aeromonas veronii]HEA3202677.1 hypothetical protein [Aeromonas veronii]
MIAFRTFAIVSMFLSLSLPLSAENVPTLPSVKFSGKIMSTPCQQILIANSIHLTCEQNGLHLKNKISLTRLELEKEIKLANSSLKYNWLDKNKKMAVIEYTHN